MSNIILKLKESEIKNIFYNNQNISEIIYNGVHYLLNNNSPVLPDLTNYVDLGLPSGTLWATCNVGATKPEEYGDYYAWGEIETKETYDKDNCLTYELDISHLQSQGYIDSEGNLTSQHDTATINLNLKIPTYNELNELCTNCTWEWTTQNGVKGHKVIGPNGNSIFLPAVGYRSGSSLSRVGSCAYYWSSTPETISYDAHYLYFDYNYHSMGNDFRHSGHCIRPVFVPTTYEYIDLGLSSGVKWATCNIGANSPEDYGHYFAWGEINRKETYTSDNYKYYILDGRDFFVSISENISGNINYDSASNWKSESRTPNYLEFLDLINECTWKWTTLNNVNGYKVTGPSGASIFLPASGFHRGSSLMEAGSYGVYWSSERKDPIYPMHVRFSENVHDVTDIRNPEEGLTIRPVYGKKTLPKFSEISLKNISEITTKSIYCLLEVILNNGIKNLGLCYDIKPNPTINSNTKSANRNDFSCLLTNLTPTTTYYIRPYIENHAGVNYGNELIVTTLDEIVHEYVDLGLPSGLKWATCNIGATSPEEYGNYYAWGETSTKSSYTIDNSLTYNKSMSDISGDPQYDAARTNWGGNWRMPTKAEMQELIDNCTWEWTTQNGVKGHKVTSKHNSNYIFLPAAGHRDGLSLTNAGSDGRYCSSTPYEDSALAYDLVFNSSICVTGGNTRYYGAPIRPCLSI